MGAYSLVMEGVATAMLVGLAVWLGQTAWRAPPGPFRVVSAGGASLCLLIGATSLQHLLILAAQEGLAPSSWRAHALGPLEVARATVSVLVAAWAIMLALRFWTHMGRAQSMVEVLTDRVPSEARVRQAALSLREREVLELIRKGVLSDDDIAATLHISSATAATHVQNILRKTGLHNRRDLMLLPRSGQSLRRAEG